jgi:hypothetical protein
MDVLPQNAIQPRFSSLDKLAREGKVLLEDQKGKSFNRKKVTMSVKTAV